MKNDEIELLDVFDDLEISNNDDDGVKELEEIDEIDNIITLIQKDKKESRTRKKNIQSSKEENVIDKDNISLVTTPIESHKDKTPVVEDKNNDLDKTKSDDKKDESKNQKSKPESNIHDKVDKDIDKQVKHNKISSDVNNKEVNNTIVKKDIVHINRSDKENKRREEIEKAIEEVLNSSNKKDKHKKSNSIEDTIKNEINNKSVVINKDNNLDEKKETVVKKNKSKKTNKNRRNIIIGTIMSSIILILLISFIVYILHINIIPTKYLLFGLPVFIILNLISMVLFFGNKWGKTIASIMLVIHLTISGIGVYYLDGLNDTLNSMTEFTEMEIYNIVVRKDSNYTNSSLLDGKTMGILDNESKNYSKAIKNTLKKVNVTTKKYDNINIMVTDLIEGNIDSILISSNNRLLLEENLLNFKKDTNSIEDISISVIKKAEAEYKHKYGPFNILISGIDTNGPISSTSRSDVNMVLTVNQHSHEVMITNVVRDMYVQLHGTTGTKDKLTHAGMYGIDMTRLTLEDFLDTEIPYYVRVNFDSVVEIIDAIGGIDVYNEKAFRGYDGYYFRKGNIHLNGEAALVYSRVRKGLDGGDWARGQHQQQVIDAIIRKVSSSREILSNYGILMNTLGKYIQTNIPDETIRKYIKDQLDSMPNWNISKTAVEVSDGGLYPTYSMPGMNLYASIPSEESRVLHSKKINDLLNKEE